tara:strand:+ start:41 stop:331 length:291 start_codon:yes stop_codon:yes gene_type:complete
MEKYFLGISIILAASIYAYTQRFSLIESQKYSNPLILRYDSWTQELCTLNNTVQTRELTGYARKYTDGSWSAIDDEIPVICEQPAASIKTDRLRSR